MDGENVRKRRKGVKNKDSYKSEVIKHSRVEGKEYKNNDGKIFAARKTGARCNYKQACFSYIEEVQQTLILNGFNSLKTKDEQDLYIPGLIECQPVQRKRPIGKKTVWWSVAIASNTMTSVMLKRRNYKLCIGAISL